VRLLHRRAQTMLRLIFKYPLSLSLSLSLSLFVSVCINKRLFVSSSFITLKREYLAFIVSSRRKKFARTLRTGKVARDESKDADFILQ